MFSKWTVIVHFIKFLKWLGNFLLIARRSHDHDIIVKKNFLRTTKFWYPYKSDWFWWPFNKYLGYLWLSRRKGVSKIPKLGIKKVILVYSTSYYRGKILKLFNQKCFFLAFWKGLFCWIIFFNSKFQRTCSIFLKKSCGTFKINSDLRSILVICWTPQLMETEKIAHSLKIHNFDVHWQDQEKNIILYYFSTRNC